MPPKTSAHQMLDHHRQQVAAERVRHRELDAEMKAAKLAVEQAAAAIAEGYAAEDQRAVAASRKAEEAAVAKVKDLQDRLTGAGIRVERAQREADTFAEEHARDLLEERAADARELALNLTRAGHEVVRLHRDYVAMRTDIDALVATVPNAVVRSDGPTPRHAWERQLRDLERAIREAPEVAPPLPRWAGLEQRQQHDRTHRLLQLRRRKRPTDDEQAEIDRLNQDRVVTPPVAVLPARRTEMAKRATTGSRPKVATLPDPGTSAKLTDFLKAGGSSAKPPTKGKKQ